jgi:hypothetical protein
MEGAKTARSRSLTFLFPIGAIWISSFANQGLDAWLAIDSLRLSLAWIGLPRHTGHSGQQHLRPPAITSSRPVTLYSHPSPLKLPGNEHFVRQ